MSRLELLSNRRTAKLRSYAACLNKILNIVSSAEQRLCGQLIFNCSMLLFLAKPTASFSVHGIVVEVPVIFFFFIMRKGLKTYSSSAKH